MPLIEIEDDYLLTQVGDIVPAAMDDDELHECMGMLCVEAADIREQLENPARVADEGWAFRARDALRYRVKDFEACRVEAIKRGLRNLPDINPIRDAARKETIARFEAVTAQIERASQKHALATTNREISERQAAEAAERRKQRAANHERLMTRLAPLKNPFVMAAQSVLDRETYLSIWAKARELYPEHPEFHKERSAA